MKVVAGVIALVGLGALGGPAVAAAQEPVPADTAGARPAAEEGAATRPVPPSAPEPWVAFTVTVGSLGFSDLQVQPVLAERTDDAGGVTETLLRRSITAEGGYHVQGSALVSLGAAWAVRVGAGVGWATLTSEYGGEDEGLVAEARSLPRGVETPVRLASGEAAIRFRIPGGRRFRPYAELGGAAERWSVEGGSDPVLPGAEALLAPVTRLGAHVAVGGAFALTDWLDAHVQGSTHLFRTPFGTATPGSPLAGGDSLRLSMAAPAASPFANGSVELTRVLRLDVGVSLRLGSTGAPKPEGGSAAEPSGTRR